LEGSLTPVLYIGRTALKLYKIENAVMAFIARCMDVYF